MQKAPALIFSVVLALSAFAQAQTGVLREVWTNLDGGAVADLTLSPDYPANPVLRVVDATFASPVNWSDRYGLRMRAYLTPAVSGNYTFWVSGDDYCELWLSTNDSAANKTRIAHVPGWTDAKQWTKFTEQRSSPVSLVAGTRYYIEALMKEGSGGDGLAVAWATSPSATPQVIPGAVLTPVEVPATIPVGLIVEAGKTITQYAPNYTVELVAQALNVADANIAATVQWSQVSGPAATLATPALPTTQLTVSRAGTYVFRATATHSELTATDDVTVVIAPPLAPDAGKALAEYWFGVDGNTVASLSRSLDYPNFPHAHRLVTTLTQTQNLGELYGQRVRGFILVPTTGSYRFYMAANEKAEFLLSTDDSTANLQSRASVTTAVGVTTFSNHASQASPLISLVAGRKYAFEIRHKEEWSTDHLTLMWQQPGQDFLSEIVGEYLAPPADSAAVVAATQEFDLAHDYILNAGRDAVLHMPRNSISFSAYESRRNWGEDTPVRAWSQVSGPSGALFSAASAAQTLVTLPKAGIYVLRYSVTTLNNTSTDEVTVEVKAPINAQVGSLTRQVWWERNFANLDALRADPAYPNHPDIVDTIPDLKQANNWADRYATRVSGILNVPAGGKDPVNYLFYVAGDDAVEFSISTDTSPANLRKVCYATTASGREVWTNEASQTSAPIALKPGGRYYVELLHKETWSSDYFAVAWSPESDRRPKVIEGSYLEPSQKAPAFDPTLTFYARAGKDRTFWWPHDRTRLAGSWVKAISSDKTPTVLWKQVSGPKSTLVEPSSLTSEVIFSAAGIYTYELAVTEGSYTHRDTVIITVTKPLLANAGSLTRSVWLDVAGATLADLLAYDPTLSYPHIEDLLPGAEPPASWADYHGTRLKGSLVVPVAGAYTFWIASDDASEMKFDLKDGQGLRRIAYLDTAVNNSRDWDRRASQKSVTFNLLAGVLYPLEILHKENNSSDYLAVAMDGPATNGREVISRGFLVPEKAAPAFNPEITVALGTDRTILWPQNQLALAALVYDLKQGPQPITYQWSSKSAKVTFDSKTGPVAMVTFGGPGVYEIKMTASDGVSTASDIMLVTVQNPLTAKSGGLLRETWTGVSGYQLVNLTNSAAYKGPPSFTDIIPNLETPSNWGDNYGQRLTGFLQVPVEGDYVFLLASDEESAFWLNPTGPAAAGAQKICSTPYSTGWHNWTRYPSQKSAVIHLVPGIRYYVQALHKESGSDDYFAMAYRLSTQTDAEAQIIPGTLLSPPDGVTASAFDGEMNIRAGEDQTSFWPRKRFTLRGSAVDYVPGPQALAYRWSVLKGPKGAVFDSPTALTTAVELPAAGTYQLQLTATDGVNTRSATMGIIISPQLAAGTGSILAETFNGITGGWVTDLVASSKFPNSPDSRVQLSGTEIVSNKGDNYGMLLRGYLHPPASGIYRFNLASDDWSEVHISPDRTPENKELACFVPAGTDYYEWRKFPDYQLSRPISLAKGKSYYIEIRYKESGWRDHLALAWLRPGNAAFEVIDGPFLSPFQLADKQPPTITLTGGSNVTVNVGSSYVDPGFSAQDLEDGNLTGSVTTQGTVDTTKPGTYVIRYVVTDSSGNQSVVATRQVTVAVAEGTDPIYPPDSSGSHATTAWSAPATVTDIEAARFLKQATFGPSEADIARVKQLGFSKWIDEQLALPVTSHLSHMDQMALFEGAQEKLIELSRTANTLGLPGKVMPMTSTPLETEDRLYSWWTLAATSPDQLRQRVALALSEILVISDRNGSLRNYPRGCTNYYDLLVRSVAPGVTYRKLLEDITFNPMMGTWLTMVRSSKAQPDENYPREIMQLFSIGLDHLNKDGTLKRNGSGNAIPTYTQEEILELSRAFTGWTFNNSRSFTWSGNATDEINPMMSFEDYHDRGQKVIVGGATIPAGQTAVEDVRSCLDILAAHPNVGPFISKRLIQRLVTSNPSPAYIFRVSKTWDNNGKGVRGDIGAVVKAILMDREARTLGTTASAGKMSEPMVRLARMLRAFPKPPSSNPPVLGRYIMWNATDELGQWPMQAPTVFNFFNPSYSPPGAILDAGIVSPEYEITTELTVTDTANYFYEGVTNGFYTNQGGRVGLDITPLTALWSTPDALLAKLETLLLGRTMSAGLRDSLVSLHTLHAANSTNGVKAMLQLITASPEFVTER
ncbi:PA14 domain-containing protein [Prosthecobacter fusiformis]|uniref:PA14 domain-containing protein n=1 Tax=Prosthecobacter fusiformis TaxID=48464 RepID=A0A4R7S0L6_9BACT|nr:DUF1800 family protein [Prosthecobacter fusiformis]TDU71199.1 PA14 domain-containing protein [Prosthecobacter fusiformis]